MLSNLTFDVLKQAIAGHAAAFKSVTDYQPAGGEGDKIFPPTYEGGKYATETRHVEGREVNCVLVDSVQSQANRMELALLEARRNGHIKLPLITVRFDQAVLLKQFSVSSLEAPHRIADAILRDSLLDGVMFRKSEKGRILDTADVRNATGLFGLCPTALVFGLWDSTGPRGGLGAKFQRALVSEMVGYDARRGVNVSSRIDPLQVMKDSGTIYVKPIDGDGYEGWTLNRDEAVQDGDKPRQKGKDGKPSNINHGNVTPDFNFAKDRNGSIVYDAVIDELGVERRVARLLGGFTVSKVRQTTVLSLSALRRLRFPLNGAADSTQEVDQAARVVLAALGLTAATLAREEGADLRSRCQLFPTDSFFWHLLDSPGQPPEKYILTGKGAAELLDAAIHEATALNLPWEDEITLTPHPDLVQLLRKSQELAAHETNGAP